MNPSHPPATPASTSQTDNPLANQPHSVAVASSSVPTAHETSLAKAARRRAALGWWIKLIVQPILFVAAILGALALVGIAQRSGWITASRHPSASAESDASSTEPASADTQYICPMMCTPPASEPGRCPVCAMELVPAARSAASDGRSILIDPATRRIANIQTAPVVAKALSRTIRAVGELGYDESNLKTLSAYVDGRVEELLANYTGVEVHEGDPLARVYSPRLYASQVELLLALGRSVDSGTTIDSAARPRNEQLAASARRRLSELGMSDRQIAELEQSGVAHSRLHLVAPIQGTVIEKLAVEGQYVKEGDPIYRLADLSKVWLQLQLFPEDAAWVRLGQSVEAEVQSLPGTRFEGQVEFIFPNVDPVSRTVAVRVVIPNPDGQLRVGDYARATFSVPLASVARSAGAADPDAASQAIPPTDAKVMVVPRDAVLMAGQNSVLYVETEPGRFEIRAVTVGNSTGDEIVIVEGVHEGEHVATRGNFLIDSQMQLAGNPSLIDPLRATALEPTEPAATGILPEIPPRGKMRLVPPAAADSHQGHHP